MTLTDKIKHVAEQKGETFASLERLLDFGQGTIRKWDSSNPSSDKLKKVANFLGVSVDWLLSDEDNASAGMNSTSLLEADADIITKEERRLVKNFKNLSPKRQDELLNQSAILLEKDKQEKDNEVRSFRIAARGNANATLDLTPAQIKELKTWLDNYEQEDLKDLI